ncbi:hypothetical protein AB0P21_04405 [Kribbella sp. NPDC056861]|uniref:hypothetical protein n=1 Tax=Kribbella sp. NPDC056861 TaxID=3154857 RepID=UPI003436E5D7
MDEKVLPTGTSAVLRTPVPPRQRLPRDRAERPGQDGQHLRINWQCGSGNEYRWLRYR